MTRSSPDEVVRSFLGLKRLIIECCDDPSHLYELSKSDQTLRGYCVELDGLAERLRQAELHAPRGVIAPVAEAFAVAWSDYKERWRMPVWEVAFYDKEPEIAELARGIDFSVSREITEQELTKSEAVGVR